MRAVWMAVGVSVAAFSMLCVVIGIGDVFDGNNEDLGATIGATLLFAFGLAGGGALFWVNYRRGKDEKPSRQGQLDQQVLTIAASGDGCLTVAEVSLKMGLSLEQSKETLSRLTRAGVAEPELRDDGELVYRVRGIRDAPVVSSEGRGSSNEG